MAEQGFLGERRLKLSELGGPVRRVIFTTYVVLVGIAVGVVVREQLPGFQIITFAGYPTQSTIVFITGLTAGLAIAMLLAGAAHARTRWRYLLLAPIVAALGICAVAGPAAHPGEADALRNLAIMALPLPFIAACFVVVGLGPRLRTVTTLAVCLALFVAFAGLVLALTWLTGTPYGATIVFVTTGAASLALEPALLVVGFDLAEVGAEAASAALRRGERFAPVARIIPWGLLVVGVAVAAGLQLGMGYSGPWGSVILAIWIAVVALGVIVTGVAMARRPHRSLGAHAGIGYLQVLVAAIIVLLSVVAGTLFEEPDPHFLNYPAWRPFSIRPPAAMVENIQARSLPDRADAPTVAEFLTEGKRPPTLSVVGWPHPFTGFPLPPPAAVNALLGAGHSLPTMPLVLGPPDRDGWRRGEAAATNRRGTPFRFFVLRWDYHLQDDHYDTAWYLVCGGRADQADGVKATCEAARAGFSPTLTERSSPAFAVALSVLFIAGAAGALALAQRRSRRIDTPVLDFLAWVLLLTGARWMGGYLFGGVRNPLEDLTLAAELMSALVAAAAIAALALAVWPASRARRFDLPGARRLATQALASLVILSGLFFLYVFAVGSGEHSQAVRGVIIVLALTWELATAGPSLNPAGEHHAFPRASRVLIFVGYLVLVASCVFMLGGGRLTSGHRFSGWDTETVVAAGLVTLGGALIISRALRGAQALRLAPVLAEPAPPPAAPAAAVVPVAAEPQTSKPQASKTKTSNARAHRPKTSTKASPAQLKPARKPAASKSHAPATRRPRKPKPDPAN